MGIIEDGTLGHWDSGWESQLGTQSKSCRKTQSAQKRLLRKYLEIDFGKDWEWRELWVWKNAAKPFSMWIENLVRSELSEDHSCSTRSKVPSLNIVFISYFHMSKSTASSVNKWQNEEKNSKLGNWIFWGNHHYEQANEKGGVCLNRWF